MFLVSLTFGAIMIVAVFRYGLKVQFSDLLILLAVAFFGMHVVLAYSRGILLGSGQLARFNKSQWFVPLARFALVLLFLGVLGWAVEGAVLAETLSLALVLPLLFLGSALPVKFGHLDLSLMGRMLKLGIKFAAALLMINLLYRVDVLMLTELSTLDQVGAYSLASNIGELLWQLPGAISVAVLMHAARDSGGADFLSRVPQIARLTTLACLVGAVVFAVALPALIPLIYGDEFGKTAFMVQILLPGIVAFAAFKIVHMALVGDGSPWPAVAAAFPALVINVLLNFLLIPRYGGDGAALASSISYLIATGILLAMFCKSRSISMASMVVLSRSDFEIIAAELRSRLKRQT